MNDYNLNLPGSDGFSLVQPSGTFSSNSGGNNISFSGSDIANMAIGGLNGITNMFGTIWNATHPNSPVALPGTNVNPNQPVQTIVTNPTGISTATLVMGFILFLLVLAVLALVLKSSFSKKA